MKESPWSQAADSYTEEVVGETITSVDQLWRQTERRRPSGGDAVKKKRMADGGAPRSAPP